MAEGSSSEFFISVLIALEQVEAPESTPPVARRLIDTWRDYLCCAIAANSHNAAIVEVAEEARKGVETLIGELGLCGYRDSASGSPCVRLAAPTGDRCAEHAGIDRGDA